MLPIGATLRLATWAIIAVISGISRQTPRISHLAIGCPTILNRSIVTSRQIMPNPH
jgi:hypothetical protein